MLSCCKAATQQEKLELNRRFAKVLKVGKTDPKYVETFEQLKSFSAFVKENDVSVKDKCSASSNDGEALSELVIAAIRCLNWMLVVILRLLSYSRAYVFGGRFPC
jgi:hypothetical protein